jgi:hypothetical protein
MIFLSLGANVQSSVILMRALRGDIDRPDHVLFADTGWEPQAICDHLQWLGKQGIKAGIPFHVVTRSTTRPGGNASIRDGMTIARMAASGEYDGHYATMPLRALTRLQSIQMNPTRPSNEFSSGACINASEWRDRKARGDQRCRTT